MSDKTFIEPNQLVRDSFRLARKIYDSGYRPDVVLVLWRGGTPVGIVVHEFLVYKGIRTWHTAVKVESYRGIGRRIEPRIDNLPPVLRRIPRGSRVLVVDDIFDTGCTVRLIRQRLRARTTQVRVATLYYKACNNRTAIVPDYYLRRTEKWVVFPHELMDLTPAELRRKRPDVYGLLEDEKKARPAPRKRAKAKVTRGAG